MKKILLTGLFFAGINLYSTAQNMFNVAIAPDVCLGTVSVVFTDGSSKLLDAGCAGNYSFDLGKNDIEKVIIHDTVCYPGILMNVQFDNAVNGQAKLSRDKKSLSTAGPREINDPGQTL